MAFETIDVLLPLVDGLIEGLVTGTQNKTDTDDRWYTSHRPLYFYQKDIDG